MNDKYFIKYMRNPDLIELGKIRPTAIVLLLLVVNRAKNNESGNPDLQIGEAYIGDHKIYGVSKQIYRTDKKILKDWQILTFKSTTKGTIAKLSNRAYFDVNWQNTNTPTNTPTNIQLTHDQHTANTRPTTNREIRNKKYKENIQKKVVSSIWVNYINSFGSKEKLTPSRKEKLFSRLKTFTPEEINTAIEKMSADDFWQTQNSDYLFRSDENLDRMLNLKERVKENLKPGDEWVNPDGTWTVVKKDDKKLVKKIVSEEDYLAQNY